MIIFIRFISFYNFYITVGTNYKIVESEDKVTSTNCLYLVGNETNGYKIYAYVDKVPKKLSDSIITLEGYAKEEELTTHINNNVAHLTAEEQTIVGKLGDENGSLTYDTKTISTINDTQASDKETYSSNKINALIQENKVAEINAEKVKMSDNTTVEDNIKLSLILLRVGISSFKTLSSSLLGIITVLSFLKISK